MIDPINAAKYITLARTIWLDSIARKKMQSPKIMKDKTK
jgi:hypothetical protein